MPIPHKLFTTIMAHMAADCPSGAPAAAIRVWHILFRKFSPLLGPLSADLLFMRSLAAHQAAFPWLPRIAPGAAGTALQEFERSLADRSPEEITAVNRALLSTYATILSDLIGRTLATRFLDGAFPDVKTNQDIEE
jgi:hypothetical protein